jgi:hypothetical protein
MYYGARLFEQAGIEDPLQTQLILGAVNVGMTFYGLYVVEKFGRRWPLFIGALWQATWLIIYAAVAVALPPQDNEAAGIMLIVATCLFIASFAGTWGWRPLEIGLVTVCFHFAATESILTNSHGCFPHSIGKRRYRVQLRIRFRRLQYRHSSHCLVLPLRDCRPITRERGPNVLSTRT